MDRRRFLLTALAGALAGPGAAEAQQGQKIPKVWFLTQSTPAGAAVLVEAFRQGMRELGYAEGKTFVLEVRYGEGKPERVPELARELVGLKADLIVATTDGPIAAVKRETRTIPIVMVNSGDRSGPGSWPVWRVPVETSPGSPLLRRISVGSGWSF